MDMGVVHDGSDLYEFILGTIMASADPGGPEYRMLVLNQIVM